MKILLLLLPTMALASNQYEKPIVGTWEVDGEADLFVFEDNNVCYRMDEDGIRTSETGRWSATASKLRVELKYNGKKYRIVFNYKRIDADSSTLVIIRSLVDGKPRKLRRKPRAKTARRWKEPGRDESRHYTED